LTHSPSCQDANDVPCVGHWTDVRQPLQVLQLLHRCLALALLWQQREQLANKPAQQRH